MYGPAGERRLPEFELDHLPGYEGSRPVRVGNAAAGQFQLDVYGELMDAMERARHHGMEETKWSWDLQLALMEFVEEHWSDPDDGIWEVRGPRRHFVHSKVMAWVAFDRAITGVERHGLKGPVEQLAEGPSAIHDEVTDQGFSRDKQAFTQYYGSDGLDASVLMIPLVGFLPGVGSTGQEHGRGDRAGAGRGRLRPPLPERGRRRRPARDRGRVPRLLVLAGRQPGPDRPGRRRPRPCSSGCSGCATTSGLLAEEYDPTAKRLVGNFPQAFSHVGLVNTARNLTKALRRQATSAAGPAAAGSATGSGSGTAPPAG